MTRMERVLPLPKFLHQKIATEGQKWNFGMGAAEEVIPFHSERFKVLYPVDHPYLAIIHGIPLRPPLPGDFPLGTR
jgi:hypothetical protein